MYSKTCLKRPLKNRQNKDLYDKWLLNEGRKYCPWSILQYFWPALSDNRSWKPIYGPFESGCFRQVLLLYLSPRHRQLRLRWAYVPTQSWHACIRTAVNDAQKNLRPGTHLIAKHATNSNSVYTHIRIVLFISVMKLINHNNYPRTYVYNGTIIISQKLTKLGVRSVWVRRRHAQSLDVDVDACQNVVL